MSKVYLTDRMIRGLSAESGRAEAWDTVVPGLGLRYSGRKKSWFFVFHSPELRDARGHRRRRRLTLGDFPKVSLADARAQAAEVREKLGRGIDPAIVRGPAAPAKLRFRDLGLEYLEREAKPKKVRWDRDASALRSLVPVFGDRVAAEITRQEIQEYLEVVAAKRGPWVPYDHLTALRRMLEWGVLKMGLTANPARGIPRERRPPRERVLTAEEVRRLWQFCEAEAGAAGSLLLRLRLLTAQRGTQLRQLNASQLERDAAGLWWNVPSKITKTHRPNRLFLGPLTEQVLAEANPGSDGWYFGRPTHRGERSQVGKSFRRRLLPAMGTDDWKGMDLRRTAATWMARGGVSRFIVKRVLGHADHEITAVYDLYSYDKEVKEAVLILEQAIRSAVSRTDSSAVQNQNGPATRHERPAGPRAHG